MNCSKSLIKFSFHKINRITIPIPHHQDQLVQLKVEHMLAFSFTGFRKKRRVKSGQRTSYSRISYIQNSVLERALQQFLNLFRCEARFVYSKIQIYSEILNLFIHLSRQAFSTLMCQSRDSKLMVHYILRRHLTPSFSS